MATSAKDYVFSKLVETIEQHGGTLTDHTRDLLEQAIESLATNQVAFPTVDDLDADSQISAEEAIAALVFDNAPEGPMSEVDADDAADFVAGDIVTHVYTRVLPRTSTVSSGAIYFIRQSVKTKLLPYFRKGPVSEQVCAELGRHHLRFVLDELRTRAAVEA